VRVVLQRVREASVDVGGKTVGRIGAGHLLLVGFTDDDGEDEVLWMAEKVVGLRVFNDADGKMNLSLADIAGDLLVVSQFTLYGDARKGRRPSFVRAAHPDHAVPLYERFLARLGELAPGRVEAGIFGAEMQVALVNDGPVTLTLEKASAEERTRET
jgi:D-tyrosyl-tRNA(Tyr) deacylase